MHFPRSWDNGLNKGCNIPERFRSAPNRATDGFFWP
nr:MAG TPA: hypothetical protein [Caudoviricetes sp.]